MHGYELEEIYYTSKEEEKFLRDLEKKPTRVLELYKNRIKPKGILNSLCFWLDTKLSTRYLTIKQILKKESKSLKDRL